jgi:hypothetical protein
MNSSSIKKLGHKKVSRIGRIQRSMRKDANRITRTILKRDLKKEIS